MPIKNEKSYWGIIIILLGVLVYAIGTRQPQSSFLPKPYDVDTERYTWEITEYARDLEVPWDLAFAPDGRLFITERPGRVKLRATDGTIKTLATLNVAATGESGLTGLTLHPQFTDNGLLYLYYTYRAGGELLNRVSRFQFTDESLINETIILDRLPGGAIHNGGRLRFGPDNKLWVLTGDGARPENAQDPASLGGKVLRLNEDGSLPEDNPNKNSPVYSLGHRNPQGLAWHPLTEELIVTEHGETAHDEINLIQPNKNYGWPRVKKCSTVASQYTSPILCSRADTWGPSGIAAHGTSMWRFRYSFFFAGLRGNLLERIAIVDGKVSERETIIKDTYGRLRAVTTDSEGNVYVSTSNHDGRGDPKPGDDRILKVSPKKMP